MSNKLKESYNKSKERLDNSIDNWIFECYDKFNSNRVKKEKKEEKKKSLKENIISKKNEFVEEKSEMIDDYLFQFVDNIDNKRNHVKKKTRK